MKRNFKRFLGVILTFVLLFCFSNHTLAADQKFIDKISKEYQSYNKKQVKEYNKYRDNAVKQLKIYNKSQNAALDRFVYQTENDTAALEKLLKDDFQQLERLYGDNKEYRTKLKEYEKHIKFFSIGSTMYQYNVSTKKYHIGTLMNQLGNKVNANRVDSPMNQYKNAVNENHVDSPMDNYGDAVNEHHIGSPMRELRRGSNIHSVNGVMWKYKKGEISKTEASKQWAKLKKKEIQKLQKIIAGAKSRIKQIEKNSKQEIYQQKCKTVNGILIQREKSLQIVSNIHKEYFGTEITFPVLIPDLGNPNVVINGSWICFEEPPVIQKGETFVQMTPLFKKLGASVKWDSKTKKAAVNKGNITITLTANKKVAVLNGNNITLSTPPKIVKGHLMVPVKFIGKALGIKVVTDEKNKTVYLTSI